MPDLPDWKERWEATQRYRVYGKRATLVFALFLPVILLLSHTRNLVLWAVTIWIIYSVVSTNLRSWAYDRHVQRNPDRRIKTEGVMSIGELEAAEARGEWERFVDEDGNIGWHKKAAIPKGE
jgi:hypothetical protein